MDNQEYQRAECFLPWNLQNNVFNSSIFPYWVDDAIYYFQESATSRKLGYQANATTSSTIIGLVMRGKPCTVKCG